MRTLRLDPMPCHLAILVEVLDEAHWLGVDDPCLQYCPQDLIFNRVKGLAEVHKGGMLGNCVSLGELYQPAEVVEADCGASMEALMCIMHPLLHVHAEVAGVSGGGVFIEDSNAQVASTLVRLPRPL